MLARGDDRAGGDGQLFERVFLVGGRSQENDRAVAILPRFRSSLSAGRCSIGPGGREGAPWPAWCGRSRETPACTASAIAIRSWTVTGNMLNATAAAADLCDPVCDEISWIF